MAIRMSALTRKSIEMHRQGHFGVTFLTFAPLAHVLASNGKPDLALLSWLGIQAVEPLLDQDFRLPGVSHRSISHSLVAALVVGYVLGAVRWLLGGRVVAISTGGLSTGGDVWGWILTILPDASAQMLSTAVPDVTLEAIAGGARQRFVDVVDRRALVTYGFGVGVYSVLEHLLGDIITNREIKPLLPFSGRSGLSARLHPENPVANAGLFGLGVLTVLVVLLTMSTAAGAAASVPADGPLDLSPVDIAAGREQNQSADQTGAAVTVSNQTSNGSTVTIENATLPEGGFVALHDSEYLDGRAPADSSIITVSKYLSPGNHTNVTVEISNAPPGNYPSLNKSRLNTSQALVAVVYRDSDSNRCFDYVRTVGENDTPYESGREPISDAASIRIPSSETKSRSATVTIRDQTLRNNTLVVEKARLPDGGFLVAHNASYQRTGDPLTSVAGASRHLPPGNHTNVTLDLRSGALTRTQVVTVRPSLDTNDNQRYDYVRSDGFQDGGYTTFNRSQIVSETAQVHVASADQATGTVRPTRSVAPTWATSTLSAGTPSGNLTEERAMSSAQGDLGGSDDQTGLAGLSGSELLLGAIAILGVLAVLPSLARRFR